MPRMRNGTTVTDPRLDRLNQVDERNCAYPSRALLTAAQQAPFTRLWTTLTGAPVLDQGREGACTGFGVTNELRFYPKCVRGLDDVFARETIYWNAQRNDPWPGGAYPGASPLYEGTSVLAAVKQAQTLGYYREYRWAFTEDDLALSVSHLGPVILGVDWWTGMMHPDTSGALHRTGQVEGGHCVLVIGINTTSSYYTIYNSWGPTWGRTGKARITRTDMAALLAANGDACVITARSTPTR